MPIQNCDFDGIDGLDIGEVKKLDTVYSAAGFGNTFFDNLDGEQEEEFDGDDGLQDAIEEVEEVDFSNMAGKDFKSAFQSAKKKLRKKGSGSIARILPKKKPLSKSFGVNDRAGIVGNSEKKISRVIVPNDKSVIVEGVNSFILSNSADVNSLKNIGYWDGKKLQELVIIFNNDSAIDFNLSLFNPSMPLDYLYSTGLNLNNKIQVAGGNVQYTDVLHNILANPIFIRNATFTITGANAALQRNVSLLIEDKYTNGITEVVPLNINLQIDVMQVDANSISFNVQDVLNRPYIPDGMDVINYRVLAGNTVTMAFYYEQKALKKLLYPEARVKRKRMSSH